MVDLSVLNAGYNSAHAGGISAGGCNCDRAGNGNCDCCCSCMCICSCSISCDHASTSIDDSTDIMYAEYFAVLEDESWSDQDLILAAVAT